MPEMLKRAMTMSTFAPGDKKKLTLRKKLRIFTDDRRVEGFTICIVLVYFLFIIMDFIVPELMFTAEGSKVTENWRTFTIAWQRIFWVIDFVFLAFFLLEIAVRVYAWGMTYVRDVLNMIDFSIVFVSFIMLFITLPYTMSGGTDSGLGTALALLRVFRIVRIFRLVVILNKIKRTRESANMMRQKAKFKRQGSPVERVIDILSNIKRKSESGAERENISFMMDVIISGDLYTVSMSGGGQAGSQDASYSTFLRDGGAKDSGGTKKQLRGLSVSKKGKKGGEQQQVVDLDGDHPQGEGGRAAPERDLRSKLSPELVWVETTLKKEEVVAALRKVDSWDFNVFDLDKASGNHPIVMLVLTYVMELDLDKSLPIDYNNLIRFLLAIEAGYKDVPFHNVVHAADVTHGTAYFITRAAVAKCVSPLDQYCMILGAAMHDFEHPGYNNAFLVASRAEVAILYNDSSVLENFHISSSFKVMLRDEKTNPFAGFDKDQYNEARATMVHCILGTDMKFHFDHLTKFKTRMGAGAFDEPDKKDVQLLLAMCMHAADVSNPAKRWDLSSEWACRVMEEFFLQGEQEKKLSLPVSPFMDRDKTDIGKCQAGFITILIKPFFEEWCNFLGPDCKGIFTNVEENIKTWAEQAEAALGERAEKIHKCQPWGEPPTGVSETPELDGDRKSVSFKR